MEDQGRKRRHDPEKKKLKKATKRARRVAKDENLNLIAIEFRCWKGQVQTKSSRNCTWKIWLD